MKKVLALLALTLGLAGCNAQQAQLIKTKLQLVQIPASFYNCPTLSKYPKSTTLTDAQVASIIVTLQGNNRTCKSSLTAIQKLMAAAARTVQ